MGSEMCIRDREMTPEVAYIAGFIAGDGHISKKNTITITGC